MDHVNDIRVGDWAQGSRPPEPATSRTRWLSHRARFVILVGAAVVGLVLMAMLVV